MNEKLKRELLDMVKEDRRVRSELAATGELFQGYAPRMAEVHHRNAQVLDAIVQQYGWPGKSLVGNEGAHAAWFILQHAIGNPGLQRICLPLLKEAVARQEAEAAHVAYLEDRICFYEGRPQKYGTQFAWDENGQMSPWKLQDPEQVDIYRQSVGLGPLAEKIEQVRQTTEGETPPDFKKHQEEMEAWGRSVGWL